MPMPLIIEYEVFGVSTRITSEGTAAILSLTTDKGAVSLGMQRAILERLFEQTKHELERVASPTRHH